MNTAAGECKVQCNLQEEEEDAAGGGGAGVGTLNPISYFLNYPNGLGQPARALSRFITGYKN